MPGCMLQLCRCVRAHAGAFGLFAVAITAIVMPALAFAYPPAVLASQDSITLGALESSAPPTADFTVGPSAPVVGQEVTFDWMGTCEAGPCSLAWENEYADGPGGNDVAWGTIDPLAVTFRAAETKYVHLEVTDTQGRVAHGRQQVVVRPVAPTPVPTAIPTPTLYRRSVAGRSRVSSTRSMRSAALPPLWARLVGMGSNERTDQGRLLVLRGRHACGEPEYPRVRLPVRHRRQREQQRLAALRVAYGHVIRVLGGLVAS